MIISHRHNETEAIWIDGLIPSRVTLERLVTKKHLHYLGLDDYSQRLSWRKKELSKQCGRDQCYRVLLGCDLDLKLAIQGIARDRMSFLYIIPPCRKPSYSMIKKSLKEGTYSPGNMLLLQYGPGSILHSRREQRYRQIIGLNPVDNKMPISEHLKQSISNSHFEILVSNYDRRSWGCSLFEGEVRNLLNNVVSTIEDGQLQDYMTELKKNHGFDVSHISLPGVNARI